MGWYDKRATKKENERLTIWAKACDACRARKAKCDEGRPSCGFCKESQIPCVYREVPPPK